LYISIRVRQAPAAECGEELSSVFVIDPRRQSCAICSRRAEICYPGWLASEGICPGCDHICSQSPKTAFGYRNRAVLFHSQDRLDWNNTCHGMKWYSFNTDCIGLSLHDYSRGCHASCAEEMSGFKGVIPLQEAPSVLW
jgi:hypothetical protein